MQAIPLRLCAAIAGLLLGALAANAQAPAALTGTVTSAQEPTISFGWPSLSCVTVNVS